MPTQNAHTDAHARTRPRCPKVRRQTAPRMLPRRGRGRGREEDMVWGGRQQRRGRERGGHVGSEAHRSNVVERGRARSRREVSARLARALARDRDARVVNGVALRDVQDACVLLGGALRVVGRPEREGRL
eukprot:270968-Chlamydomonas_euryale.AAC.1